MGSSHLSELENVLERMAPRHRTLAEKPFILHDPPATQTNTLSLHDALPISTDAAARPMAGSPPSTNSVDPPPMSRSEEHTSELQSHHDLVCRLLLEKKKYFR